MRDVKNCPNCGAVVHDCVCDYCGTVFQINPHNLCGKDCVFAAMGDDGELFVMGVNVREIEHRMSPTVFYSDTTAYWESESFNEYVTVTGSIDTDGMLAHKLRKLKEAVSERLGEF